MVDSTATSEAIKTLGLTENDYLVYQGYIKHGESSAALLARNVEMDKSSVYRASENLERLGLLVKNFQKRGTTYHASSPDVLNELYTSRKNHLDNLIAELKKQGELNRRSTYITIEKGLTSLQHRMTESLESKEKLIREKFNDQFRFFEDSNHAKFVIKYAQERARRKIRIVQLEEINWKPNRRLDDVMIDTKKYYKEIRRLPEDAKFGENSLRIWDDTVNILSEDDSGEFIIITIKDKFVVELMKNMYDLIWNRCPLV